MSTETADTTCATSTPVTPTKAAAPGSNQNTPSKETDDAMNQLVQGKRHLLVKDYVSAVATLGKACELLAAKFGDTAPECGDAYLSYGKALLELARQETGVLEMNESDKGDDSDDEEGDEDADGENEDAENAENGDAKEEDKKSEEKDVNGKEVSKTEEESKEANGKDEKEANGKDEKEANGKDEKEANGKDEKEANGKDEKDNSDENKENEVKETEETKENGNEVEGEKMEDEDDVNNLQLSWEMLELAKVIFQKMKEAGEDSQAPLKLAEVYLKLGEVGVESENYTTAVEDMKACLEIQREVLEDDDRRIAETLFQMGAAYSMNNDFDAAIEQFKQASLQIERRIAKLEKTEEPATKKAEGGDAFYSVEGEIKELKALLPEIQEKITDMQDFKKETMRRMMESLAAESAKVSSTADGAGPSSAADKSEKTDKPVSSIAHLVKRKPKDEVKEEVKSETEKADTDGADSSEKQKTTTDVKKDGAEVKEKDVSKDKVEIKDSEVKDQPMEGEKAENKAEAEAAERKRKSQDEEPSEVPKKAKIDEAELKPE